MNIFLQLKSKELYKAHESTKLEFEKLISSLYYLLFILFLSGQLYLAIINNGIRGIIETVDIDILAIINILIINHLKKN